MRSLPNSDMCGAGKNKQVPIFLLWSLNVNSNTAKGFHLFSIARKRWQKDDSSVEDKKENEPCLSKFVLIATLWVARGLSELSCWEFVLFWKLSLFEMFPLCPSSRLNVLFCCTVETRIKRTETWKQQALWTAVGLCKVPTVNCWITLISVTGACIRTQACCLTTLKAEGVCPQWFVKTRWYNTVSFHFGTSVRVLAATLSSPSCFLFSAWEN